MVFTPEATRSLLPEVLLSIGVPEDQIRLIVSLFVCFPISFIQSLIPNAFLRKFYSIISGILVLQFTFLEGWIHSLTTSLLVYLFVFISPKRYMPIIVSMVAFGYLSVSHVQRILWDYMGWTLNYTTYLMVFIMKYTSFCYDLYDGLVDKEKIDQHAQDEGHIGRMYKQRQHSYITSIPSLFDYLSYIFHISGSLAGPVIFYREYMETIEGKRSNSIHLRSRLTHALLRTFSGFLLLLLYAYLDSLTNISHLASEESSTWSFLHYMLYVYICGFISRMKYHGTWKISEGVCIVNGFGYQGKDEHGNDQWNGILNTNMIASETATNLSYFTRNWNIRTQQWLQRYVYQRTNGSLFCLYLVSAFWHGFYPGYYIFFLTMGAAQYVGRMYNQKVYSRLHEYPSLMFIYNVLAFLATQFYLSVYCCCFVLMSYNNSVAIMNHTFWMGYILLCIGYLIILFVPAVKEKSK